MARNRQLASIPVGNHAATVSWEAKVGPETITRWAPSVPVRIEDKWCHIYLGDGDEIIRLSRTRNTSAQVYVGMSLRDVLREKTINRVEGSSECCYGRFGQRRVDRYGDERVPCTIHTQGWLDAEIDQRVAEIESQPAFAVTQAVVLKQAESDAKARAESFLAGNGEWRKVSGVWLIAIDDHQPGDIVLVRRSSGSTASYQLGQEAAPGLFYPGPEVQVTKAA